MSLSSRTTIEQRIRRNGPLVTDYQGHKIAIEWDDNRRCFNVSLDDQPLYGKKGIQSGSLSVSYLRSVAINRIKA